MMNSVPMPGSSESRRFEAPDVRADEHRRVVIVAGDRVVIVRSVAGVFMRITLRPSAYRGILLRLACLDEAGFRYEIHLAHRDPDLGVSLAQFHDEAEAQAEWRLWSRFFGLPKLVERVEGTLEIVRSTSGGAPAAAPGARRRGRGARSRRPRFLIRRKVGRPQLFVPVWPQRELFGGSMPE
jgi:hypothetical protein